MPAFDDRMELSLLLPSPHVLCVLDERGMGRGGEGMGGVQAVHRLSSLWGRTIKRIVAHAGEGKGEGAGVAEGSEGSPGGEIQSQF